LLKEMFKDPPLTSYKRGRSLKDILVKAELRTNRLKHMLGSHSYCTLWTSSGRLGRVIRTGAIPMVFIWSSKSMF